MIEVFLREKKLAHGKRSLYPDFCPAIVSDGKKIRHEHLKPCVHENRKEN